MTFDNRLNASALWLIALALESYHARYGSFPPAYIADSSGKPMHSWRVLLLFYIEQDALYRAYRFDEPWDGPNNRQLGANMPLMLACPSDPQRFSNNTCTNYLAVVGPGTAWTGVKPVKDSDIRDGPGNTILVVEVLDSGIHWMDPRDLRIETMARKVNDKKVLGISSKHVGGALVAMADGSVRFLDDDTTRATLNALLTRAGGETVEFDD